MRRSDRSGWMAGVVGILALVAGGAASLEAQTETLAQSAARQCAKQKDATKKIACYEGILLPVAETGELGRSLAALEELATVDPDVRRDGHMYVHGLGIAAYDAERDPAETFMACTELFHAGCYHGVIQAHFTQAGAADSAGVNDLCPRVRERLPDGWIYFQCVHGLGHGLTILNGHDLLKGLQACDLLNGAWERDSCYGGAFMENVGNATQPHHSALTASASTGDGAQHDPHAAHAAAAPFHAIDTNDPHYPCTIVGEQYLAACYGMQTTVMLHLNGSDFEEAAETCDGAPAEVRSVCHQSLGRDASGFAQQDQAETLHRCGMDRSADAAWCYVGAVKAITDWSGTPDEGLSFCAAVEPGAKRTRCYEGLGEQINIMMGTDDGRRSLCGRVPAGDQEVCLYGARLIAERPAALRALEAGGGVH